MATREQTVLSLRTIAERIGAHLRRFEADTKRGGVNDWDQGREGGTRPFYFAGAQAAGRYVRVVYKTYQGGRNLSKDEALAYLAWLDAGNAGTHYASERAATKRASRARTTKTKASKPGRAAEAPRRVTRKQVQMLLRGTDDGGTHPASRGERRLGRNLFCLDWGTFNEQTGVFRTTRKGRAALVKALRDEIVRIAKDPAKWCAKLEPDVHRALAEDKGLTPKELAYRAGAGHMAFLKTLVAKLAKSSVRKPSPRTS